MGICEPGTAEQRSHVRMPRDEPLTVKLVERRSRSQLAEKRIRIEVELLPVEGDIDSLLMIWVTRFHARFSDWPARWRS